MDYKRDVAIVIPGGPRNSADRIGEALKSYKELEAKGYDVHLIATGFYMHDVIYNSLIESGVLEGAIIRDENAKDTEENVINSMEICKSHGWKNILFATSYYQAKRLVGEIKEHIPEGWNVGWVYEEPDFSDIGYDAFLFLRYLHELGATIKDTLGDDEKKGSAVKTAVQALLRLEGEVFSRLKAG